MTVEIYIFVLLAIALVVFLAGALQTTPEDDSSNLIGEDPPHPAHFFDAPPHLLLRIFGDGDFEFIRHHNNPRIFRLFRSERKRLALLFLADLRAHTRQVKTLHTRVAREAVHPNPSAEIQIAFGYFSILFFSSLLSFIILLFGISAVRFLAVPASALAGRLSRLAQIAQSVRDVSGNSVAG